MTASEFSPESATQPPERFAPTHDSRPHQPLAWWESFADPVLNQVVAAALASNLDLEQAVARVRQARARARMARAELFPMVTPSIGAVDLDSPTNAGIGAQLDELGLGSELIEGFGFALPDRLKLRTYHLGAEFAYEADFWGRNRKDALAAGAQRLASEADYLTARISVLAETIGTYLEVMDSRRQAQLAEDMVEVLHQRVSLSELRYERGLSDLLAVYRLRRELREAGARLPRLRAGTADAEARLWVLLGGYSEALSDMLAQDSRPSVPAESFPVGIPAHLLNQRPDVAAAEQRMLATGFAMRARRAELLPSLSLSGTIGLQATDANDWFDADQWFQNLSLNLLGPVIQGGRLRANVELAEARLQEATAAYGKSVLAAVHEVEAALVGFEASRDRHELLTSHLEEADAEATLQEQRYTSGVGNYGELLAATQMLIAARSALSGADRELGYAQLALHRALGGTWSAEEGSESQHTSTAMVRPVRTLASSKE